MTEDLDYSCHDIPNPFPLGIPERVRKEMDAVYDATMKDLFEPAPEFTIDYTHVLPSDRACLLDRAGEWLDENVGAPTSSKLIVHLHDLFKRYGQDLRRVTIFYDETKGWCVKTLRVEGLAKAA